MDGMYGKVENFPSFCSFLSPPMLLYSLRFTHQDFGSLFCNLQLSTKSRYSIRYYMEIPNIPLQQLLGFFLVLSRISAFLLSAPIFSDPRFPARTKIGLALLLSVIIFPLLPTFTSLPGEILAYGLIVFKEVMVGVIIGYAARLVFAGIEYSGELMGYQMGLGIANVIDPQGQNQIPIISQFQGFFAMLIFLVLHGHHWMLLGFVKSFESIPLSEATYSRDSAVFILKLFGDIFVVAFKIGAPVIIALLLTNVALGVLSRAIPQMHVFFISHPLTIAIGLISLAASLQVTAYMLEKLFLQMRSDIATLISTL